MQQFGFPELVVVCTVTFLLCWGNKIPDVARKLNDAIANFRGGPGPPLHPMPAEDSKLLNRKGRSDERSDS
jgi:Sec-independent protein translocase protein TatA